jgi:hypothetical protein
MEPRKIPSPNNSLTFFMEKMNGEVAEYETAMVNLEKQIEKRLIDTFRSFDINATVKSDRYSLPYTHEIKHTGYGESYLNGAFESMPLFRKIFKEILDENLYKIRFYIFAEIEDQFPMGKVNYYFRYYKH